MDQSLENRNSVKSQTCDRLLRARDVMQRLGIKKTKFYTAIRAGTIPRPRKLTSRSVVWPESVIAALVEDIKNGELVL
mgnify:CR=1 FL=1